MRNIECETRLKDSLNQLERHVLIMHYCDKLSPLEIGAVLDITVNDVEYMLNYLQNLAQQSRECEKSNRGAD